MTTLDQAPQLLDRGVVIGSDGQRIGKIGQVFIDNTTDQITWVTVHTALFGMSESFVPMDAATIDGDEVTVPYDRATVKGAPRADVAVQLTVEQEDELYEYYQLAETGGGGEPSPAAHDGYVTRSEEQLHVGTERVEAGRARLRKYIVTEQKTVTVPVTHDEVRILREPITDPTPVEGVQLSEDSIEVTLMQDEVLVRKDVVGVEKVKLTTEQVTDKRKVTEKVRKEKIEILGDTVGTVDEPNLPGGRTVPARNKPRKRKR